MIKVFQKNTNKDNGDCLQAAVASMLEMKLEEVPKFIEYGDDWYEVYMNFMQEKGGYQVTCMNTQWGHGLKYYQKVLKKDGGVNGYFIASVVSCTLTDTKHAVVIDSDMNIVHDPNPNQRCLKLTYKDILDVDLYNDIMIGSSGKVYSKEEWETLSDDEKIDEVWNEENRDRKFEE